MIDHFAILGLTPSASDAEIKEAYRRLAKKYHPDSNPQSEDAARRMRLINQAKAVLFDPVKREEHRVMLSLKDTFSPKQIDAFRNRPVNIPNFESRTSGAKPPVKTDRRPVFLTISAVLTVLVVGAVFFGFDGKGNTHLMPIDQIIRRHQPFEHRYVVPEKPVKIPNDTLPVLRNKASILLQFGEYRVAAAYLKRCLEIDSTDEELIRDLSLSYFKQGLYARSLQILSKQMRGDSNLVASYYNVGEMFLSEGKPFDARNSFEEVIRIADRMQARDQQTLLFLHKARARLELQ